jgi:tetratricopeptide (TPR) repeat protein
MSYINKNMLAPKIATPSSHAPKNMLRPNYGGMLAGTNTIYVPPGQKKVIKEDPSSMLAFIQKSPRVFAARPGMGTAAPVMDLAKKKRGSPRGGRSKEADPQLKITAYQGLLKEFNAFMKARDIKSAQAKLKEIKANYLTIPKTMRGNLKAPHILEKDLANLKEEMKPSGGATKNKAKLTARYEKACRILNTLSREERPKKLLEIIELGKAIGISKRDLWYHEVSQAFHHAEYENAHEGAQKLQKLIQKASDLNITHDIHVKSSLVETHLFIAKHFLSINQQGAHTPLAIQHIETAFKTFAAMVAFYKGNVSQNQKTFNDFSVYIWNLVIQVLSSDKKNEERPHLHLPLKLANSLPFSHEAYAPMQRTAAYTYIYLGEMELAYELFTNYFRKEFCAGPFNDLPSSELLPLAKTMLFLEVDIDTLKGRPLLQEAVDLLQKSISTVDSSDPMLLGFRGLSPQEISQNEARSEAKFYKVIGAYHLRLGNYIKAGAAFTSAAAAQALDYSMNLEAMAGMIQTDIITRTYSQAATDKDSFASALKTIHQKFSRFHESLPYNNFQEAYHSQLLSLKALVMHAQCHLLIGRVDLAKIIIQKGEQISQRINPQSNDDGLVLDSYHAMVAKVFAKAGERDAALYYLNKAKNDSPNNRPLYYKHVLTKLMFAYSDEIDHLVAEGVVWLAEGYYNLDWQIEFYLEACSKYIEAQDYVEASACYQKALTLCMQTKHGLGKHRLNQMRSHVPYTYQALFSLAEQDEN